MTRSILRVTIIRSSARILKRGVAFCTSAGGATPTFADWRFRNRKLNGRGFDQLLTLTTGTVNYTSNVGLQRQLQNTFSINGVENNYGHG